MFLRGMFLCGLFAAAFATAAGAASLQIDAFGRNDLAGATAALEAFRAAPTAGKVLKPARLKTGFEVQVPLFCNTGDKIEIDTATGEYRSRTKG